VLSLRLVIFAALASVALWGLFSLLDNLREPELLRSAKAVIVKGCEPMDSQSARQLCPQLFCQKSLLDAGTLPLRSRFEVTVDQGTDAERLIGGVARGKTAGSGRHFACVLREGKIAAAQVVDAAQLGVLSAQHGDWRLN
jgi:hypothetical protein